MCQITYYKHVTCRCMWVEVTERCGQGMGFETCPDLAVDNMYTHQRADFIKTGARLCPWHGMGGCYDSNDFRKVIRYRRGIRIGTRPGVPGPGIDLKCVVM